VLPGWLDEPLRAVLHDLQRPTEVPITLRLFADADSDLGDQLYVGEHGGGATGIWLHGERGVALTLLLADQLQEQFFPETEAAWGEARPACPGHSHPASPVELDGDAWWVCPRDERRIARIGEYAAGNAYPAP
jgi:hypothetical protein